MHGYAIFSCIVLISIGVVIREGCTQDVDSTIKEPFMTKFQEYQDVIDYLTRMERRYPNLIELETLGYSVENREILLAKIGTKTGRGEGSKPSIWLDSAMHAREWISVSLSQHMIDTLVKTYDTDNATKDYVDKLTWYILPIMNPDGYEFSREKNYQGSRTHFLWRKNRRPADCNIEVCNFPSQLSGHRSADYDKCYGVDLNRNFGHHWGHSPGGHASNDSCDDQYVGPQPFSERETYAIRDFITRRASNMKAYFTLHSYAQMWFYPYGYARGTYPDDYRELHELALRATSALRAMYGTTYQVGSSADIYYPSTGSACDWAKGAVGIKYVYAIELRPQRDTEMAAFLLPWEEIEPTVKETFAAIKVVADEVIKKFAR